MKAQPDLFFDEAIAASAEASNETGMALRLGGKNTRLSPAQQRFNRLLARIDKLKGQSAELQALADAYRPLFNATLTPLRARFQALLRRMVLWLDQRLQGKDRSLFCRSLIFPPTRRRVRPCCAVSCSCRSMS